MTLIAGIGDEVTHFFIGLFIVIVVTIAWWTTNISEQRHIRTVLLLERRRHRTHRRLTNHTETVTITEGTPVSTPPLAEENPNIMQDVVEVEPSSSTDKPPEEGSTRETLSVDENTEENVMPDDENSIIQSMDEGACILRRRRLAFYNNWGGSQNGNGNENESSVQPDDLPRTSVDVESRTEEVNLSSQNKCEKAESLKNNKNKSGITIKLKYINDDLKLVDGKLEELLGDFKKRHFQTELMADKRVRLIFNGQVLQPDTQTLKRCGLFDNCVVHCLIHQKRMNQNDPNVTETRREGYSFPTPDNIQNINNNNQNREWDLGNFLFAFISFILLAAWYFRYVYAHLYTVSATVGLILITGLFTIVLVGMYFPDNEHLPNPTIRIARERVPPQQ